MKLSKFIILALVLALLGFLWSCDSSDDNKAEPKGTISGTVTDVETSAPLNGVAVSVLTTDRTATTGTNGVYTIGDVTPGTYTVQFTLTGFDQRQVTNVVVTDGQTTTVNAVMSTGGSGTDEATGSFNSTQSGYVETPGGARVYVPVGAVPNLENGDPGTIVFSIESDPGFTVTPPAGETMASQVYMFGPEGFNFASGVTIEIPIMDGVNPEEVSLYRVDPTSGGIEYYCGTYDTTRGTVKVQTYHFSPWFLTNRLEDQQGNGCAWVTNNSDKWITLCVTNYELAFPEHDSQWVPAGGWVSYWAPWDHDIGVTNEGEWWLPQGTYTVCIAYSHDAGLSHVHRIADQQLVIDNPAHGTWTNLQNWDCTDFEVGGENGTEIEGNCDCTPVPTIPVGTGDVQVTLTWFNESSLDLDLWVTDPTGEMCYYGNNPSSTGGVLDRDNLCGNYENGRPENIYWTSSPPAGEYIVEVDWFYDCGNGLTGQAFNVRTVVQGVTQTFSSSVTPETQTVEVARFTVTGGSVIFAQGQGPVDRRDVPRPEKN